MNILRQILNFRPGWLIILGLVLFGLLTVQGCTPKPSTPPSPVPTVPTAPTLAAPSVTPAPTVPTAPTLAVPSVTPVPPPTEPPKPAPVPAPKVGRPAPDFILKDLDGNPFRLSDLWGKVVFINFWASWCPPCRAEMPDIEAVYQKYKDKGVVVVGIDIQEPTDVVRQFVRQGGYSWSFVLDSTGKVAGDYQIAAIPSSFFLDKDGTIRAAYIGAMSQRAMESKLAEAMR